MDTTSAAPAQNKRATVPRAVLRKDKLSFSVFSVSCCTQITCRCLNAMKLIIVDDTDLSVSRGSVLLLCNLLSYSISLRLFCSNSNNKCPYTKQVTNVTDQLVHSWLFTLLWFFLLFTINSYRFSFYYFCISLYAWCVRVIVGLDCAVFCVRTNTV